MRTGNIRLESMLVPAEALRYVSRLVVFTLAYVLTGMLGLLIQTGHEGITPIWPPSGIALYAFIRYGPRMWPLVLIGILILGWLYSIPPLSISLAALGNICEALLGWQLTRHFGIVFGKRLRDTWYFLLFPVLMAPLAGASIGALGMIAGGAAPWEALPFMWLMWWLGDAGGILLFTPLLFAWHQQPAWFQSTSRMFEWLVVTGFAVFLGWYTFVFEQQQLSGETVNIMFLVTPFLLWASIRLGLRGATLVSLIACCWVLWGSANETGPFAMENVRLTGMIESSFILVITLTALVVQALFREHMLDIEMVRKANDELTERVRQRTAELEQINDELSAAKEAAELANASKTRFLVAASHDLRQPLQAMTTHTELLDMHNGEPGLAGNIEQIRIANRTMGGILDKLVDISKLESGEVTTDVRVFAAGPLLDELVKQYRQPAAEKGLSLEVSGCERSIRSDVTLLRLILQNLISNAIRYTASGGITIDCLERDGKLRIAITDTGIGIREEEQDMIFEEFYQLDNPARERSRGMGMGLAIVRHLATLLDHPLSLHSSPGHGSTFSIDVPVAGGMEAPGPGNDRPAHSRQQGSRERILLVDDDVTVLESQQMLLQAMGYRVHGAEDINSALRYAGQAGDGPDLVISDYRLPGGITGTDMVEQLRKQAGRCIPAIILTGDITLAGLEHGPGDCELLRKPVSTGELERTIRQQLTPASERSR